MPSENEDNDENDNSQNVADNGNDNDQGSDNGGATADDGAGQDAGNDDVLDDASIDAMEDPNELKEKLKATNKQNSRLFERTKKAEGFVKGKDGKWVKKEKPKTNKPAPSAAPKQQDGLSSMDTIAVIGAGVTEKEDIEEVMDYAKMKKISVADALKAPLVKSMLAERKEHRDTANATNTGPSKGGAAKPSTKTMLDQASKTGELPEDEEGMAELADARLERKKSK